ncbi:uncharacterized protein LOC110460679 [Mizuhopecten yessoensis]|uniref:WSC domain-containing protein n=1 Tax=Mizuhopecten yessoensis TaxID=6573 RepID=A0A210Q210_MIZYE|nr:uncharacterized protein LOC110460679 [Mizuhopecten yessoensis]OWF42762.1 hypothetical protein KP79_PYT07205 [Mizuhopecten yessoensis]
MEDSSSSSVLLAIWILICCTNAKAANIASTEWKDWYAARRQCKGEQLVEFVGKNKTVRTVVQNLNGERHKPAELKMQHVLWTGGHEVYTPWIRAEGCHRADINISNNNKPKEKHTFRNNQASVCAMACSKGLFLRLNGETCECFVGFGIQFISSNQCNTTCPGNTQEKCGGPQAYTTYTTRTLKQESITHTCAAIVYDGETWTEQASDCNLQFPFIYQEEGYLKSTKINNTKTTWMEMREYIDNSPYRFFTDVDALNKGRLHIPTNETYWICMFRRKSIIWNDSPTLVHGDFTGQCLAMESVTVLSWLLKKRDCDDKLRYVCETSEVRATVGQVGTPSSTSPHPSHMDDIRITIVTTNVTTVLTTEVQSPKEILGMNVQMYIYIVIGVGSAVFVSFLFGCGIMIRKCLRTTPKNNNAEVTKTSVVSSSEWLDTNNSIVGYEETDDSGNDPGEEHIYNEIIDVDIDVIRINNYSEPLPLRDPTVTTSRDYATPYDAIKIKAGIKKIKRKRTKNYSSVGPVCPDKGNCSKYDNNAEGDVSRDTNPYHVCNLEVKEKGSDAAKIDNLTSNVDFGPNKTEFVYS